MRKSSDGAAACDRHLTEELACDRHPRAGDGAALVRPSSPRRRGPIRNKMGPRVREGDGDSRGSCKQLDRHPRGARSEVSGWIPAYAGTIRACRVALMKF